MKRSAKGNDKTPLREAPSHYTEEYGNPSVYLQRMERLSELGYNQGMSFCSEIISDWQNLINRTAKELAEKNFELVQISCDKRTSLLYRPPGSPLPTAQEDFDQPAGADIVTAIAATEVANTHRKRTHDQILTETGKEDEN